MNDTPIRLDGLVPDALKPRTAKILLDSLEVRADIGFHDFEIGTPQRLLVTVEIWLDHVPSAGCDDPSAAWDYDLLREQIEELAAARRYNLQESLAHRIYDRVASMGGVAALGSSSPSPTFTPMLVGLASKLLRIVKPTATNSRHFADTEQNPLHGL